MSILVSSNSSPMLLQSSRKEEINPPSGNHNSNDSVVINDSLLLSRYAATLHYLEENELKVVPALYHHKHQKNLHSIEGGSAVEEEDTESEEDDDEDHLPSRVTSALNEDREANLIEQGIKTPLSSDVPKKSVAAASFLNRAPLSSSISHPILPPIQTYSPQLNFSLYSPCSTPVASIRSGISKNNYRAYSTSSALYSPSCLSDTSITVQNPTTTKNLSSLSFNNQQRPIYLTSSSSFASTIKMDIRSPPQPSQSTSRFMNAFQRFRSSSINQNKNHSTSSVAPAEIISSIKPSPSKSSLADKIKTKFQQLDKKKKSSVLDSSNNHTSFTTRNNSIKSNNKKKNSSEKTPTFSMPRSASISSITNWSSRLTANNNNSSKSKSLGSTAKQQNRLSKSTSLTSFLSSKTHHSLKPSISSSSSSSCSSSESVLPTTINTNAPLSLTKSISSHRLYNKNTSSSNNSDGDRPRQPLRAVNPNDSVRLARHSFQSQQRQQKKKGGSKTSVRFTKLVSVRETYSKSDYDRGSDPEAVCTRLTPAMAQHIKEELNAYKLHEMQVHEFSRVHTHFFL